MHLTTMCLQNLLRRRLRTSLCILGIALATMFIVAIGATTMNYVSAIKEMNMFFNGEVVVVSRGVFVIYAFPIGGSLPESILDEVRRIEGVNMVVPMLFVISHNSQDALQLVPETIVLGIPAGEWRVLVGSTPLEPGGRWPSTDHGTMEVVLGPSLAHERNLTVGSRIEAKSHHLMVTGVLETRSVFLSRSIIMPLTVAQKVYRY
ncbi:hypothetical protein GWN63_02390, partial [Candidatus Bathyarchaeota archaeon]|nr:hypothetical protein [Candidatus Bathyarchaeota archaeon]NIV67719.1 hypothetical protein [Candidatus Bathyarchaeota archaeon]